MTSRSGVGLGVIACVVGLAVISPLQAGTSQSTLTATLKDVPVIGQEGRGIKLVFLLTMNHRTVRTIPVGTYTLVVNDQSRVLNFHLIGPGGADVRSTGIGGRRVISGVERKQKLTFNVRLSKGKYTYYSDPHASVIRKYFRVS